MDNIYKKLAAHSFWRPDNSLSAAQIDSGIRQLVCEKGSLTSALVSLSDNNFMVNVVNQAIAVPYFHEQRKLHQPLSRAAMIRQVELKLHGETVVFARSIIPLALISKGRSALANLGRTPLGHLLFKDGKIRVSKREFAKLMVAHNSVTARRTPYDYQGRQILVSEFFMPTIYKYL